MEEIHSLCATFCDQFEFDRFLYGARIPTSFVKPYFIFINGYPGEWRERYTTNGYMVVDPTVLHCATHLTPISWDQVGPQEDESD